MSARSPERTGRIGRRVASASLWVTAGMLAGRVAGIVRELLIADTFGATRSADVAILLITAPDMLVTLAGSGAVGLVLIPILLDHQPDEQYAIVRRLTKQLAFASVAVAIVVTAAVLVFATGWASTGELSAGEFRLAALIAACAVPFSMVVVLTAAFLRAQDRFAVVSTATLTFTIPVIVATAVFRSIVGVAIGLAVGASLRYGLQAGLVRRHMAGFPKVSIGRTPFREEAVLSSFAISVLQAAQVFVPLLIAAAFATEGDVALVNYGWRVLLIPIGLLGAVFSVAAYPSIVKVLQGSTGDEGAVASLRTIVRIPVLAAVAVAAWLWVNSSAAVRTLYRPTDLDAISLDLISREIRVGAAVIPLLTIASAATTVMFGSKQVRLGLRPYLVATPVLVVGSAILAVLEGPVGVLWGVLLYAATFCVAGLIAARSTMEQLHFGRTEAVLIVSAAIVAIGLAFVVESIVPGTSVPAVVVNGLLFVGAGGAAYLVFSRFGARVGWGA